MKHCSQLSYYIAKPQDLGIILFILTFRKSTVALNPTILKHHPIGLVTYKTLLTAIMLHSKARSLPSISNFYEFFGYIP
jgi:hypothetical protein